MTCDFEEDSDYYNEEYASHDGDGDLEDEYDEESQDDESMSEGSEFEPSDSDSDAEKIEIIPNDPNSKEPLVEPGEDVAPLDVNEYVLDGYHFTSLQYPNVRVLKRRRMVEGDEPPDDVIECVMHGVFHSFKNDDSPRWIKKSDIIKRYKEFGLDFVEVSPDDESDSQSQRSDEPQPGRNDEPQSQRSDEPQPGRNEEPQPGRNEEPQPGSDIELDSDDEDYVPQSSDMADSQSGSDMESGTGSDFELHSGDVPLPPGVKITSDDEDDDGGLNIQEILAMSRRYERLYNRRLKSEFFPDS